MSSEQLDQKNRIARKPHSCDYCGKQIKKGEEYEHKRESYLIDNGYTVLRYDTESDNMLGFLGVISDCIAKKGAM